MIMPLGGDVRITPLLLTGRVGKLGDGSGALLAQIPSQTGVLP